MNTPVVKPVHAGTALPEGPDCAGGVCAI